MSLYRLPDKVSRTKIDNFMVFLDGAGNVNEVNDKGRTSVFVAARLGKLEHLLALIGKGADVNLVDAFGESPFQVSCRKGHCDAARILLRAGAELDYFKGSENTIYRETAMGAAVRHGNHAVFEMLCDFGADPNIPGDGTAPLHLAVNYANDFVLPLLRFGAQVDSKDKEGDTALHTACREGNLEVVRILLDAGASVNVTNNRGETPLHCCFFGGNCMIELIQAVLAKGPDLSIRDKVFARTPAECAVESGLSELAALFGETIPEPSSDVVFTVAHKLTPEEAEEYRLWREDLERNGPYLIVGESEYNKEAKCLIPPMDDEGRVVLSELNSVPARPFEPVGWVASRRHCAFFSGLEGGALTLERMAYFARGHLNGPLSDGEVIIGESYKDAAGRLVGEGLIEKVSNEMALDMSFTSDQIRLFLAERGLNERGTKLERIEKLLGSSKNQVSLLAELGAKDVFQITEKGQRALSGLPELREDAISKLRTQIYLAFFEAADSEDEGKMPLQFLRLVRNLVVARNGWRADAFVISESDLCEFAFVCEGWVGEDSTLSSDPDHEFLNLVLIPCAIDRLAAGKSGTLLEHFESMSMLEAFAGVSELVSDLRHESLESLAEFFALIRELLINEKLSERFKLYDS